MKVLTRFGPQDHGRPVTEGELEEAQFAEGARYEVIDGRLFVSPSPNLPADYLETWIREALGAYRRAHPTVINHVTTKARIFIPGQPRLTVPEPDVAAYRDFPHHLPVLRQRWQDVSPILVAEILTTEDDPDKDLVRNVDLYHRVPSIKEYWVVDGRTDPDEPTLLVYRRWGSRWRQAEVPFGGTYETRLLPGFALVIDPRQ